MSRLNSWSTHEKVLLGIDNILFYLQDFYGPSQDINPLASTKNSRSFLDKIQFADSEENLSVSFTQELAQQIFDLHGDGVITGIILLHALLKGCLELLTQGALLSQLIDSLKEVSQELLLSIEKLSWPLKDPIKLYSILFTATQNSLISKEISQIFEVIGQFGTIALKVAHHHTEPYITQGFSIKAKSVLPHGIKTQEIDTITAPKILITDQYIHSLFHLLPCLQQAIINKDSLVIICRDISPDALATLTINKLHHLIDVTVLSLQATETPPSIFEDLSLIVGTKVFSMNSDSAHHQTPRYEELGSCESVELSKLGTIIVQGLGAPEVLALKIRQLEENCRKTICQKAKQSYLERIYRLQGSVAVLSVPQELYSTYLLAITNLYEAIEHGYVIGGGATLFYAVHRLTCNQKDHQAAYQILKQACLAPLKHLVHNANIDHQAAIQKLLMLGNPIFGINTNSQQIEDFFVSGVLETTSKIKDIFMKALLMTINILTSPHVSKNL